MHASEASRQWTMVVCRVQAADTFGKQREPIHEKQELEEPRSRTENARNKPQTPNPQPFTSLSLSESVLLKPQLLSYYPESAYGFSGISFINLPIAFGTRTLLSSSLCSVDSTFCFL